MSSDKFANYQIRHHEAGMASHFNERHGLVTSYDPKTHLAKVTYQPDGEEFELASDRGGPQRQRLGHAGRADAGQRQGRRARRRRQL